MPRHESGDMDLAENPKDTKMLRHESEDVDLVDDPYLWMLRHESEDMDLAEDPSWLMLRHESDTWIRSHGSCRGSCDMKMLRHESGDVGSCRGSILVDAKP